LASTLGGVQVAQLKTQGQTNERETPLVADNIRSMTCRPLDDGEKRISVVIRTNREMREKKGLPKTITLGINGEPVDFKSKGGGEYQRTGRLTGGEVLGATETLDLAHGVFLEEHFTRAAAEMTLHCNTRTVSCDRKCRSAKSNTPCVICMKTCGIDWENLDQQDMNR
jgi:hypothetical protein